MENYFKTELPYLVTDALLKALKNTEQEEILKIIDKRKTAFSNNILLSDIDYYNSALQYKKDADADGKTKIDEELEELNELEKRILLYFQGVRKSILALTNSTK